MKITIKILAALLSLCMLLPFSACHKNNGDDSEESESESESVVQPMDEPLLLADNGAPLYDIVYEDPIHQEAAIGLQTALKSKTNLNFSCVKFAKEGIGHIFVGVKPSEVGEEAASITGYGYGAIAKDGNIYICGYYVEPVTKAASDFVTVMTTDNCTVKSDDGKTQQVILPEASLFIKNPEYLVKQPKLMSVDLSKYTFITDDGTASANFEYGEMVLNTVSVKTGVYMKHTSDKKDAGEYEIVFGDTSRPESSALKADLAPDEFIIKSVGKSLYIVLGSYMCVVEAMNAFHGMYDNDMSESILVEGKSKVSYKFDRFEKPNGLVRFMTYNVLTQSYDTLEISAGNRQWINADCILTYMPDVVGCQEVDKASRRQLQAALSEYYQMVDVTDDATGYCYVPIFYRKDLYNVIESDEVSYENGGADMWGYVWVLLESKTDPTERFIMLNTHFPGAEERRLDDHAACNAELKRLQEKYPDVPMLMTGDFNAFQDGDFHNQIYGDVTNKFDSAYDLTEDHGLERDYAWVDMTLLTYDLATADYYRVLDYDALVMSTDHKPVFADVKLSKS